MTTWPGLLRKFQLTSLTCKLMALNCKNLLKTFKMSLNKGELN
jgi:hypothetical protein